MPLSKRRSEEIRAEELGLGPVPILPPGTPNPLEKYTPERLLAWGTERADAFCEANRLRKMDITAYPAEEWRFDACAFWREDECSICLSKCARPATEAQTRNWNWPGTVTDRTPYGVVCHELGHHFDVWTSRLIGASSGAYTGDYSRSVRHRSKEAPLTSYCPDDGEWFAEMFRLFVTNHALLKIVRPRTHAVLVERFRPVSSADWKAALGPMVPERVVAIQTKR